MIGEGVDYHPPSEVLIGLLLGEAESIIRDAFESRDEAAPAEMVDRMASWLDRYREAREPVCIVRATS